MSERERRSQEKAWADTGPFSCSSEKHNEVRRKVTKYERHKNRDNIKRGGAVEREEIVLHPCPSVGSAKTVVHLMAAPENGISSNDSF